MARIIYRISPGGPGWVVHRDGLMQSAHDTKQPAVDNGCSCARREWEAYQQPSACVLVSAEGVVQQQWLYGKDN